MSSHKNMKGSITITRPRGSHGPDYAQIEVNDDLSGTRILSARIPLEAFAEALLGLSNVECSFDLNPDLVGLKREHKEELVPLDNNAYWQGGTGGSRDEIAAKAFAPFEVDGWKGRVEDLFNHHRRGLNGSRVTFVRYVSVTNEAQK